MPPIKKINPEAAIKIWDAFKRTWKNPSGLEMMLVARDLAKAYGDGFDTLYFKDTWMNNPYAFEKLLEKPTEEAAYALVQSGTTPLRRIPIPQKVVDFYLEDSLPRLFKMHPDLNQNRVISYFGDNGNNFMYDIFEGYLPQGVTGTTKGRSKSIIISDRFANTPEDNLNRAVVIGHELHHALRNEMTPSYTREEELLLSPLTTRIIVPTQEAGATAVETRLRNWLEANMKGENIHTPEAMNAYIDANPQIFLPSYFRTNGYGARLKTKLDSGVVNGVSATVPKEAKIRLVKDSINAALKKVGAVAVPLTAYELAPKKTDK